MNKKLSMAVAGAVMAFGASAANAGITIPAGDWTIDIGGNVNAYFTSTTGDIVDASTGTSKKNIQTGLLPSAIGIGGKTRQNDLDVAFQFTFFTGVDGNNGAAGGSSSGGGNSLNIRQAFMTFGDKSWGTIKAGRDLGIYASDAILSDMTLLGVGVGAGNLSARGGSSTLGRIGSGYIYADWVGQISYWSPNWNGFSFAVGVRDPWANGVAGGTEDRSMGFEGKVNYDWSGDVSGKVWASFITQKQEPNLAAASSYTARGYDVGAKVAVAGFGLVGYYYDGRGLDSNTVNIPGVGTGVGGLAFITGGNKTDDKGGYVQGTYTLPTVGTKLGVSYGTSKSDVPGAGGVNFENKSWVVGAYHPLTKSLNLVAEYTKQDLESNLARDLDGRTVSLGAIMFF